MKKLIKLIVGVVILAGLLFLFSLYEKGQESQGMKVSSRLLSVDTATELCPENPNCVSSKVSQYDIHYVTPIKFSGALDSLKVPSNCSLYTQTETHRHFHCQTALFGFVDDLELLIGDGVLEVLSASRVGYSDLEANRKRVEWIRSNN
jgi:uncharacterized protein (DUF1499 family)